MSCHWQKVESEGTEQMDFGVIREMDLDGFLDGWTDATFHRC